MWAIVILLAGVIAVDIRLVMLYARYLVVNRCIGDGIRQLPGDILAGKMGGSMTSGVRIHYAIA